MPGRDSTHDPSAVPLVVLAGGAGTRFGGEKPLAEVGPGGESLLDYTVFDATRLGFDPIVIVASPRNRRALEDHLVRRHDPTHLRWAVQQQLADTPGRTKPWGTVHAVVSAAAVVDGAFAVANSDDFYGFDALQGLSAALRGDLASGDDRDHLVTYPWQRTIPPTGSANRGVCSVDPAGRLVAIEERRGLTATSALDPDAQVSMNLWGFGRSAMTALADVFEEFAASHRADVEAELAIPEAVSELVRAGRTVMVHPCGQTWIGVTYPSDVEWARRRLGELLDNGVYPPTLRAPR